MHYVIQFLESININVRCSICSCVAYKGVCSCSTNCIGETIQNSNRMCNGHVTVVKSNSECAKHLRE